MAVSLILPGVTLAPPASLPLTVITPPSPDRSPETLKAAMDLLPDNADTTSILGAPSTPALLWLAAALRWPDACLLLEESGPEPGWRDIRHGERLAEPEPDMLDDIAPGELTIPDNDIDLMAAPVSETAAALDTPPEPAARQSVLASPAIQTLDDDDKELLSQIFRVASWGPSQENRNQLESLRRNVVARQNPDLSQAALKAYQDGNLASFRIMSMEKYLRKYGPDALFNQWLKGLNKTDPSRVVSLVRLKYKSWLKYRDEKRKQHAAGGWKKPTTLLTQLNLEGRPHPNSLRHLPPHDRWDILIDESGTQFEQSPGGDSRALGRIVALAIPVDKVNLPPLKPGFHATKETDETLDLTLKAVLETPVGVLGITTRDPLAGRSPSWFTSIYHLLHLLFRLLPLTPGTPAVVRVLIEQRGGVMAGIDTTLIEQMLKHQLASLDDSRFNDLQLEIRVVDKNAHPANGYCDAIAHCWGGKNRERLKRTAFAGNCFLSPDDNALERLFAALDGLEPLEPAEWYRLAAVLAHEPEHSLAHGMMRQLGEKVRSRPELWRRYLDEVRSRLLHKSYRLPELAATLGWLDTWKPEETALPKRLQLQWHTASLASANHLGQVDLAHIAQCLQLGKALWEEAAPEVCQSALRIAVACTNAYEFDNARVILTPWCDQPAAVCGLLNRGKLLSSLGQVDAFLGDPVRAVARFDEALDHFARLSDPEEAERESAQTRIYRLITLMDCPDAGPATLEDPFRAHFGAPLTEAAAAIALSGDDRRFEQHVLLRALVLHPELREARDAYLRNADEWQFGEGHPWTLIHAWRGWLLRDAGREKEAGSSFRHAVELCRTEGNGPVLWWMGEVLAALAVRLGLDGVLQNPEMLTTLRSLMPHAPYAQLNRLQDEAADPREVLAACLPFNFR